MASGTTPYNAKVRENMLKDCLTDFAKNYPYRCRTDPKVLDFCKHYLMPFDLRQFPEKSLTTMFSFSYLGVLGVLGGSLQRQSVQPI